MVAATDALSVASRTPSHATRSGVTHRSASLHVDGIAYRAIDVSHVRPGDIGIEYKRRHKTWRQKFIAFGTHCQSLGRGAYKGSPHVLHTFVVVGVDPQSRQPIIVDAANRNSRGTWGVHEAIFDSPQAFTDQNASTLMFRFHDADMQAGMVRFARNWAEPEAHNFSIGHAIAAPYHRKRLHRRARRRLLHVGHALGHPRQVPAVDGDGMYRVMCSEMVALVASTAAMSLYAADHGLKRSSPRVFEGLARGRAGATFDCDPRAMTPSALHARLTRNPAVRAVGYLPPPAALRHQARTALKVPARG